MANYYMIGGDGKEYGPVDAAQLRQWVVDGRANAQTQVRPTDGGAYTALGAVPELAGEPSAVSATPSFSAAMPTDYFMRGGDGREYGPVSAQQLRQWVAEGRANAQTQVRAANGGPYVALGQVPELTGFAGARSPTGHLPLAQALAQSSTVNGGSEGAQIKRLASVVVSGSGWIKCMAILMFLSGGLWAITIWGLLIAWIPLWLGVTLWSAVTKAENALMLGAENELLAALEKLRFFFKLSGIGLIIFMIFGAIFLLFAVGLAMAGVGSSLNQFQLPH